MSELKPCPFCGGTAVFLSYTKYWVVCTDCLAETSCYATPEEAAEAWNRRADDDTKSSDHFSDVPAAG